MNRIRSILIVVALILILSLYFFPKVSVNEQNQFSSDLTTQSDSSISQSNQRVLPLRILRKINKLNISSFSDLENKKNATFVDSLVNLYRKQGFFDSVAWFTGRVSDELKTTESELIAGNAYYDAFTFATEKVMQQEFAAKTREYLGKVIETNPKNLEAKSKMAMTYMSSNTPMKGVAMLKEVVKKDSTNEFAIFNLGMLSLQSGQYEKSIEWMKKLTPENKNYIHAQFLLGVSYMKSGETNEAIRQFEKVKKIDKNPEVQATVDSYLQELK